MSLTDIGSASNLALFHSVSGQRVEGDHFYLSNLPRASAVGTR
jgi:hypothetical protein